MDSFSRLSGPMTNAARAVSGIPAMSFSSGSSIPYLQSMHVQASVLREGPRLAGDVLLHDRLQTTSSTQEQAACTSVLLAIMKIETTIEIHENRELRAACVITARRGSLFTP